MSPPLPRTISNGLLPNKQVGINWTSQAVLRNICPGFWNTAASTAAEQRRMTEKEGKLCVLAFRQRYRQPYSIGLVHFLEDAASGCHSDPHQVIFMQVFAFVGVMASRRLALSSMCTVPTSASTHPVIWNTN